MGHRLSKISPIYSRKKNLSNKKGICKIKWKCGDIYEGEFKNCKLNGLGTYISDKYIYKGEFLDNMKHGKGSIKFKKFKNKYKGEFSFNYPNGFGIYNFHRYHNKILIPYIYIGEMLLGKMYGIGKLYKNGTLIYYGEIKEGYYDGYGISFYKNGKINYVGKFKNNLFDGEGILYNFNNNIQFMGIFYKNKIKHKLIVTNKNIKKIKDKVYSNINFNLSIIYAPQKEELH
jgi:hypothetical protein